MTHFSLETPKTVTGKQSRPKSDAAIFLQDYLTHMAWHTLKLKFDSTVYSVGEFIQSKMR